MSAVLIHRLRLIETEFLTCRTALEDAERHWSRLVGDAQWEGRSIAQVKRALDSLEGTYVIRLFSEFEGILRERWAELRFAPEDPNVGYLIDHVAHPTPPSELRERVHEVQYYRNALVHSGARQVARLSLEEARTRLAKFLERLPDPR